MQDTSNFFKTFLVRFFPFGTDDCSFLAVVRGHVTNSSHKLIVTDPRDGTVAMISASYCLPVSDDAVHAEINGYLGWNSGFGEGIVASGVLIAGLLYVDLFRDKEFSGLVPITEVGFTPREESSPFRVQSDYRT